MNAIMVTPETLEPICQAALVILKNDNDRRLQSLQKDHALRKVWWFQGKPKFSCCDLSATEKSWLKENTEAVDEIESLLSSCSDAEKILVDSCLWRKLQQMITGED
jgi:hypothetical protein